MRPGRSELALLIALVALAAYAALHEAGSDFTRLTPTAMLGVGGRMLGVVLTYWLGRRVGGPGVGLPAAFFLAVADPQDSVSSSIQTGPWAAVAVLLGLLAVLRVQERCSRIDFIEAGLGIGLAGGLVGPGLILASLIWLADSLRPANINRALNCAPTFAERGLLPAGLGLGLGALGGWAVFTNQVLSNTAVPAPSVDVWIALGVSLGSGLLALALAGSVVAVLRRSPKGLLLAGAALLLVPALALWPTGNRPPGITMSLPILVLLGALALRTTVGSLLSPVLAQARALTLNSRSDLVRALTAGRVLRLIGPVLLTLGALLLAMPLWTPLLP